ncbi:MAG: phosphate ABC transporter ATP-binding protein [Actinobacteria bacterium]|nr:phosphate ABC transporter ATP-binding protein [Actinomycetota bacterium]MBO0818674.1 phosphate ABC transporter ATP-binding protein [Actinomycetota bacterium]
MQSDPGASLSGPVAAAAQPGVTGRPGQASFAAPAAGDGVISTEALTLGFGQRDILRDITLDVRRGAITALLGPTGSGKTTLLRTFNRMNDKVSGYRRSGDVRLEGTSIWNAGVDTMSLRRRVGMLFQRPNPFPMSIMDNVVAGVRAHKLAQRNQLKRIAEDRLREVGLLDAVSGRLSDSPFRLSGGQQQLLCLARALAVSPDVLLLDEPTSSLDPVATESIEALIRTLTPRLTVIIVTHNLAQARRVADRTIFLNNGRLVEHGETSQVFENPAEEETAQYVSGRFG